MKAVKPRGRWGNFGAGSSSPVLINFAMKKCAHIASANKEILHIIELTKRR